MGKKILLVEDNPDDVELALLALQASGMENSHTVVARDGQEALDYLQRTAHGSVAKPEVILLDLKLPRIDGFEVLKRVRANPATRYLPIVILSSSREERDLITCYELGANSYIQKSLDFSIFSESVRQIGQYWLCLNEVPWQCPRV
ncbi:MAG TPA: response regulator [Gallionellaceae bacterium]|nr:response regulator [Gallionellaceae bacterium]